jgi:hypothetical protein
MNFDTMIEIMSQALKANDRNKFRLILNELIDLGYYPKVSKGGHSAEYMVECYGVDWNVYRPPHDCSKCGAELRDLKYGPPFKREISYYNLDRDRTEHFICPDCRQQI